MALDLMGYQRRDMLDDNTTSASTVGDLALIFWITVSNRARYQLSG